MTDGQDIFGDNVPATTTEGVSPEAPSPQPRDDGGRFAARDTGDAPPAEAAVEAAPPAAVEREPGMVPLAVVLDDREKRQRAEAEAAQLRARLALFERQQQPAPAIPDAIEDQQGFASYIMEQQQQRLDNLEAGFSERMARREYGAEAVDAALAAAREVGVVQHFTTGPDRWERMCEWHKQHKAMSEIGNDPVAYRAKLEAEIRAAVLAEMQAGAPAAAPSSPAARIPPSLASAGSAGQATVVRGNPLFD